LTGIGYKEKCMSDKNVMVVEDNEKNRKLMRVILKAKGYTVTEASTGEEALNILKNQKPDIILMDIQLPGIDGITLAKQIKGNTITKDIPIIAVTAYAMKGDKQKILECGCDDYVSKPINTQELPLVIEKYIKK
jgi:CheY-like chemotaxis protein